jgi:hypothetical protein
MAHDDAGVDVEYQPGYLAPGSSGLRELPAGVSVLRPGDLAGRSPGGTEPSQRLLVDSVQHPPRGGRRGDRSEQLALVPQHRQIGDRLAAVGEHHRQVRGDPAGIVPASPLP